MFKKNKPILDSFFELKNMFNIPSLKDEWHHGDVALVYISVGAYIAKKDGKEYMGLSLGLYGAILMGWPNES